MDKDFLDLVFLMMRSQKEYFRSRDKSQLEKCKFLERQVDERLNEYLKEYKELSLFEEEDEKF